MTFHAGSCIRLAIASPRGVFYSTEESIAPLRAAKLIARLIVGPGENARPALLIFQGDRKLRAGLGCFENVFIAVALWIQDEGLELFVNLEDIRGDRNTIVM